MTRSKRQLATSLLHAAILICLLCLSQQIATAQVTLKVEPAITQPDGILTLTFSKPVKVTALKIGALDTTVVSPSPTDKLQVTVPSNAAAGRQQITGTVEGEANSVTGQVIVAPLILGLKANKDAPVELSRAVVAEGEVLIQFGEKIPSEVREKLDIKLRETLPEDKKKIEAEKSYDVPRWIAEDSYLLVTIPKIPGDFWTIEQKTFVFDITADGIPLQKETRLRMVYTYWMYLWAFGIVSVLVLLIFGLLKFYPKSRPGQPSYNFVKMLLLEPENQTYSLSRAQFAVWLLVIVWSYLFLYTAHGFVEENWYFPNLGNSVYAFLISLGTLLASQATDRAVGVKGAGEFHPSLADLVVHGGVLALDRVQQVVWTLIAAGMFIRITVSTYGTATELPDIPAQLLTLMGLSSAGYLGGKLVRGPGPVIDEVVPVPGSLILSIKGKHLSKDGFVWLDGVQQLKDKVSVKTDDPDDPTKFARELEVTLDLTLDEWNSKAHAVTVINPDAQRADWRKPAGTATGTSADTTSGATGGTASKIDSVTPGEADAEGKVPLTIKGSNVAAGATIEIKDAPDAQAVQDGSDPNLFTATVDAEWPKQAHDVILTSGEQQSTFTYKPTA